MLFRSVSQSRTACNCALAALSEEDEPNRPPIKLAAPEMREPPIEGLIFISKKFKLNNKTIEAPTWGATIKTQVQGQTVQGQTVQGQTVQGQTVQGQVN